MSKQNSSNITARDYNNPVLEDFDEYEDSDQDNAALKAPGYKIFTIVILLLGIGGLFIGMLSKAAEIFAHKGFIAGINGEGALSGCMMGGIIEIAKGFFTDGGLKFPGFNIASGFSGVVPAITYILYIMIAVAIVLSLIFMIVAFIPQRHLAEGRDSRAKLCFFGSAIFMLLAYGLLFFTSFLYLSIQESMNARMIARAVNIIDVIDIPLAIIFAVLFLIVLFATIGSRKGFGFLNVLLMLLATTSFLAFCYPQAKNTGNIICDLNGAFTFGENALAMNIVLRIALLACGALVLINFIFAILRVNAKRGFWFDFGRYLLQLILAVFLAIMMVVQPYGLDGTSIAALANLAVILLIVSSVASYLLAFLIAILKKKESKLEGIEDYYDEFDDDAEFAVVKVQRDDDVRYRRPARPVDDYEEPATVSKRRRPAPEAVEEEPAPAPAPKASKRRKAVAEVVEEPAPAPAPAPNVAAEPAPAPAKKATSSFDSAPMTDFERQMMAYASDEFAAPKANQTAPTQSSFYQPSFDSNPESTAAKKGAAPAAEATQFTYDPFINSLTPQERAEFSDMFIANKYGAHAYLPVYVIGGDNREFFNRAFIYLGRYRNVISKGLLAKLYNYVSSNR